MPYIVKMPTLGLTTEEGRIVKWHKKEGEYVEKGEDLFDVETEKVVTTVESPFSGILRKILVGEGEFTKVGNPVAIIVSEGESVSEEDIKAMISEEKPVEIEEKVAEFEPVVKAPPAPVKIKATPRAKKLAKELGLKIEEVAEKLDIELITEEEIKKFASLKEKETVTAEFSTIKMEGMLKTMSDKMYKSSQETASVTYFIDVIVDDLVELRDKILPIIQEKTNERITYTDFIIKGVAKALREHPILNSYLGEGEVIINKNINIGVATAVENGLIVPVIKDADKKSLIEIVKISKELIRKARNRRLSLDEVTSGTFTISNLGMYGVKYFTPIINIPERAILGVGTIEKDYVEVNGAVELRNVLRLSLTWDHRVMDGVPPAKFLKRVKEILENPYTEFKDDLEDILRERTDIKKVVVIGGGIGGYSTAIRLSQLGKEVILVEKDKLGGTCLNKGCVPTKILLEAANNIQKIPKLVEFGLQIENIKFDLKKLMERKEGVIKRLRSGVEFLLNKNKIKVIKGKASLVSDKKIRVIQDSGEEISVEFDALVIATGSTPITPKFLEIDKNKIITSDEALDLTEIPKKLLIIGGGVIGIELGYYFASFDSEVTIVEMMKQILPQEDGDAVDKIKKSLESLGVNIFTDSKVVKATVDGTWVEVEIETPDEVIKDRFDKVLVAVGRAPNTSDLNLESIGVEIDESGFLKVNEKMETTVKNVYAVGDVTGKWMLAHVALKQGLTAAENIAGMKAKMDYGTIPRFLGSPEFAAVGINEKTAKELNMSYKVYKFPYLANSKAVIDGETEGFIKILTDHSGRIIGGCIVGKNAINLISELSVAVANKLTLKEITNTIHPHPTYSEVVWECAMGGEGKPIHY